MKRTFIATPVGATSLAPLVLFAACRFAGAPAASSTADGETPDASPMLVGDGSSVVRDAGADAAAKRSLGMEHRVRGPHSKTIVVDIPDLQLGEFARWRDPDAAHPKGTVIALAYPKDDHGNDTYEGELSLAELDVGGGTCAARRWLSVSNQDWTHLRRSGDLLDVVAIGPRASVWITYDLAMSEVRRVSLQGLRLSDNELFGFVVHDNRIVIARGDATTLTFDAAGAVVGKHDCRSLYVPDYAEPTVEYFGGRAVVGHLEVSHDRGPGHLAAYRDREALCAFPLDGQQAPDKVIYRDNQVPLTIGDAIDLLDNGTQTLFKLGADLRPRGAPIDDPRDLAASPPCEPAGDFADVDRVNGVDVLNGHSCCGGPAAIFEFCTPGVPEPEKDTTVTSVCPETH